MGVGHGEAILTVGCLQYDEIPLELVFVERVCALGCLCELSQEAVPPVVRLLGEPPGLAAGALVTLSRGPPYASPHGAHALVTAQALRAPGALGKTDGVAGKRPGIHASSSKGTARKCFLAVP